VRRSSRIQWQLDRSTDWSVREINELFELDYGVYDNFDDAYRLLEDWIKDGNMHMNPEQYAEWRREYEEERMDDMGNDYVFERTNTDDEYGYEPDDDAYGS
jgi:hypothetical protein